MPPTTPTIEPERRASALLGALFAAVLALAFLWKPIARYSDGHYAPTDISQVQTLTSIDPKWYPANELLSDVYAQMHPWVLFQRDEIHAGRLPLWNPWNGNGAPHLANFQSAVFSPFTLPYYVLPFRAALIVAAFAKLFALGFLTYLFLRELRLSFAACATGAAIYAFAAHQVLLIGFPHSGVAAVVPAALFVIERYAQALERDVAAGARARSVLGERHRGLLVAWVATLALGVLAGHPEAFYFCLALIVAYALARFVALWRERRERSERREIAAALGRLAAGGVLAASIASIVLLPFFEYLRESAMLGERTGRQIPLSFYTWPIVFFPNILGNPANPYYVDPTLPRPNFTTATMSYIGGFAVFAAIAGFALARARKAHLFFAIALAAWVVYAYDVAHVNVVLSKLPTLSLAPINRSQMIGAFAVAACAALTVDRLARLEGRRRFVAAAAIAVAGAATFFAIRAGAASLLEQAQRTLVRHPHFERIGLGAPAHVAKISASFAAGVVLLALVAAAPRRWMRCAAGFGCALVAFAQGGWLLRNYNPVTPDRFVYSKDAPIAELSRVLDGRAALVLGDDCIVPPSNLAWGVRQIQNYDALGIRRYDDLYLELFGRSNNWRVARRASVLGLQLFGVDYVLDADRWPEVDTAFAFAEHNSKAVFTTGEIVRGAEVVQELTGVRDGLGAIRVRFERPAVIPDCTIVVVVEDASDGRVLGEKRIRSSELVATPEGALAASFDFDRIADSASRTLRLSIASPDARPGYALKAQFRQDWSDWIDQAVQRARFESFRRGGAHADVERWKLSQAGTALDGQLYLDLSFAWHDLVPERTIGRFAMLRLERALGRFHTVGRAVAARDGKESWQRVVASPFDPSREVVIDGLAADSGVADASTAPQPKVLLDEPEHVRLSVERASAGWLVTSMPWYPGWKARVNGAESKIERANHAFAAIEVPAGACVVDLVYEPASFRIGLTIATAALVGLAAWLSIARKLASVVTAT